jgi:hypothetical protein
VLHEKVSSNDVSGIAPGPGDIFLKMNGCKEIELLKIQPLAIIEILVMSMKIVKVLLYILRNMVDAFSTHA